MSEEVVGIDFEALNTFRENVEAKLPNGTMVKLPLITMRDAAIANIYLRKFDLLRTKYSLEATKLMELGDGAKEQGEVEDNEANIKLLSKATDAAMEAINRSKELVDATNALIDEVLKFLAGYVKDIKVSDTESFIDFLRESEPTFTIRVLQCMMYGKAALAEEADDSEEKEEDADEKKMTE